MKLLIDGDIYSWHRGGGISRVFDELVPLFQHQGVSVEVAVKQHIDKSRISPNVLACAVWIPQLSPRLRPWRLWKRLAPVVNPRLVNAFWRRRHGDIFLSSYYTTPPVRAKSVCVVYDMIFELFPKEFDPSVCLTTIRQKRDAVRRADAVICISQSARQDLVRLTGVPDAKCHVVHLGASCSKVDEYPGNTLGNEPPFLLYVGDFRSEYKNFKFILFCLGRLSKQWGEYYELVVASRDLVTDSELQCYASMYPLQRLKFINNSDDATLFDLYRRCAAFVYPSKYEGFGLPVLEALGCGAPVVCSSAASIPEVGGDAVYYFAPESEEQFRVALKSALSEGRINGAVARRKNQAGQFSWQQTAAQFLKVFYQVTGQT